MDSSRESFTELLRQSRDHESSDRGILLEQLVPLVYDELKQLAGRMLGGPQPSDRTLQSTALVHEVYLRMVDQRVAEIEDRNHFRSLCARVMRRVIVDQARARNADKRGGGQPRVMLETAIHPADAGEDALDVLALDQALEQLSAADQRKAQVVEMRWFGGLTHEEIAEALGVSVRTVEGDWFFARAWLREQLT